MSRVAVQGTHKWAQLRTLGELRAPEVVPDAAFAIEERLGGHRPHRPAA